MSDFFDAGRHFLFPNFKVFFSQIDFSTATGVLARVRCLFAFWRVNERNRDISTISEDGSSFTLAVSRKRRSQQTTEASRLPRLNQVANTDAGACRALRSIERDS